MTIPAQDVEIYSGQTATLAVTLTDANGDPFVLSPDGKILWWLCYTSHDDPLVSKDLTGGIILDGSVAEIGLSVDDTALDPGIYYHTMQITDLNDVAAAMTGAFVVRRWPAMGPRTSVSHLTLSVDATVV